MANGGIQPVSSGTKTDATLDQALTSFKTLSTRGYESLFFTVTASVQAFDQFQIDMKPYHSDAAYVTLAGPTTATDFTSPVQPLVHCSGNLAALSGASGWGLIDVRGIDEIDFKVAFAADNGTYVFSWGLQ